ncbi:UDP-3-O-acylglucosamine N-acyltransferase [Cellvibrio zantedeschiae]|uniref:UDP-3-O-acylglucosamine N-acyltransferase n=1 Tax=Cellvibrio zantedeschiae TaxID=1237077 RepID=A0ABQ3AQL4_9GAMM|nr:UDP-3-O-(3-hydroxymyristoyl)glucosamine N-acyltransferase [Cellvibrio zantedeschiae]GGY63531.1 UDP-3-O-acylglucosamine N-acyltransferase [Cellvibrio zantedeschiae]
MSKITTRFTLAELAQHIGAELVGNPQHEISSLATLQAATQNDLSFIANPAYKKHLSSTQAGAVICAPDLAEAIAGNKLIVANPYLCYAQLTALFNSPVSSVGVHESAVVGKNCVLGKDVWIQPNAVIGDNVNLGDGVVIGAGAVVGTNSSIGARTRLYANVTVYHDISIGEDCIFHSGCVIGADGFGFAPASTGWMKIHQLGSVVIGNNVEIGANTTIDRGALDNTFIDDGVIIDNLVQIGHNVRLGKNTAIAAHTAIAGSTTIGDNCTIAGAVAIAGHVTLADRVHITGMSMVSNSISEAGSYSSGVPLGPTKEWRKNAARFRQLDSLATRIIKLARKAPEDE